MKTWRSKLKDTATWAAVAVALFASLTPWFTGAYERGRTEGRLIESIDALEMTCSDLARQQAENQRLLASHSRMMAEHLKQVEAHGKWRGATDRRLQDLNQRIAMMEER